MHAIDFSDVPDFTRSRAVLSFDDPVTFGIAKLPETAERAYCAKTFCWRIVSLGTSEPTDKSLALRQGFMRASLAEFVGMEESLPRDLLRLAITAPPIKANSGTRPLLHIIRELRNFELHLHSSPLTEQKKQAIYPAPKETEEPHYIEHLSWIIDDLTESQFLQLRNARHYRREDIPQLVAWFNAAQREWGIHDLIFRAIETFSSDILSRYTPYLPKESTGA